MLSAGALCLFCRLAAGGHCFADFIFFVNYKWLFEYSLKKSCIICIFMKQRKWAEVTWPLMKRIRHRFYHLRLQTEPFKKDTQKKISKYREADRCGRSLPGPATSTAWSCCVWEAAFKKKHQPEEFVEAQRTQKSSCTNKFTCKCAFFCSNHTCISFPLTATDELMQVKLWVCKNFSPNVQFAANRRGSHPLGAIALLRLMLRKGHLKCIRITSIQAPAAFCSELWDFCSLGHAALGSDLWLLWKQLSLRAAQHNSLCLDCVIVWPELLFLLQD